MVFQKTHLSLKKKKITRILEVNNLQFKKSFVDSKIFFSKRANLFFFPLNKQNFFLVQEIVSSIECSINVFLIQKNFSLDLVFSNLFLNYYFSMQVYSCMNKINSIYIVFVKKIYF